VEGATRPAFLEMGQHSGGQPCTLRSGRSVKICNELRRIEADGVREVEEFHDIDPPFAAFDPRNVGLPPIQPVSECGLSQLRVFPRLRQQFT
jgi:hypothetical protein